MQRLPSLAPDVITAIVNGRNRLSSRPKSSCDLHSNCRSIGRTAQAAWIPINHLAFADDAIRPCRSFSHWGALASLLAARASKC